MHAREFWITLQVNRCCLCLRLIVMRINSYPRHKQSDWKGTFVINQCPKRFPFHNNSSDFEIPIKMGNLVTKKYSWKTWVVCSSRASIQEIKAIGLQIFLYFCLKDYVSSQIADKLYTLYYERLNKTQLRFSIIYHANIV